MKAIFLSTTCLIGLFSASTLHAQTTDAASPADAAAEFGAAEADIVVTGSRIARRDYISDSPIVTQSAEQITNTGIVNIDSVLTRLPQFVPGQGAYTAAQGGRATLNLRGLGEQRNLILLDGRRLPPATALGVVNVNIIPKDILEGIETISGGASATYGSDAISGVVNFKTRRAFDGIQIDIQKGISERGDVPQTNINFAAGVSSDDDASHALISLGYFDRDTLYGLKRAFFRTGAPSSFIFGGTYTPSGTNLPDPAVLNSIFAGYSAGSVSTASPLGFNDNGTLFAQQGGANYLGAPSVLMGRFNNSILSPVGAQTDAASSQKRYSIFVKADHEISDTIKIYTQALYVDDEVRLSAGWVPSILATPSIPVTNPFIPDDLRTLLASRANPNAPFSYNRRFDNLDQRIIVNATTTYQMLIGATGKLGIGDLTWDIYGSKGQTKSVETFQNAILLSRLNNLFAAPDGGNSICAGGFNPFGIAAGANISEACKAYLSVDTHAVTKVQQDVVEGQVQGTLFQFNGNDVKLAISANYRRDKYDFSPDASIAGRDVLSAIVAPAAGGSRKVTEQAVELAIPLIKDKPFFDTLELDLGYRNSQYSITGSVSTYKASAIWKPVPALLLRGGYEHAIRAPGLAELYAASTGGLAQFGIPPQAGDPCDSRSIARTGANAAQLRSLCIATGVPGSIVDAYQYTTNAVIGVSSGSRDLSPEVADTFTLGAVFRPQTSSPLLSGLSFSADYYDIRLKNAISTIAPGTVINKCYNLDGSNTAYDASNLYCGFINRDGSGGIATVDTPYLNLGGIRTRGMDFQLDWSAGLGDNLGRLSLNATLSWLHNFKVSQLPGNPYLEYRDTIDSTPATGLVLPKWRSQAVVTYALDPVEIGLTWQHIPGMRDVTSVTRPSSPAVGLGAYDRFDLRVSFDVADDYQLSLVVNNLTDRNPPRVAGTPGLTQAGTYDIFGRSYMMSLRAKF